MVAQYSSNIGFEKGDFSGWKGYNWLYSTASPSINTSPSLVNLPTARRQVLMSDTTAYDSYTGGKLKIVPKGYRYSCRLGDAIKSDANPRCWEQSMRYTMKIDSTNALLVFRFACVLQYATSHDNVTEMEPRFKLSLLDSLGNNITQSCANYDVYASGTIKGFQSYTPAGTTTPVMWRDWTTVGANLLSYIGKTVTLEFMTADCTGRYHYGYAYFVVDSQPLRIGVQYCSGDTKARLIAPGGFETYKWTNEAGVLQNTQQVLELDSPQEGAKYYCEMVSATGCDVTLSSTIVRYEPNADFKVELMDCNNLTNTLKFTNTHKTANGTLLYDWDFGEGTKSQEASPEHVFKTSGKHKIKLVVSNPPSTCTDTVVKTVDSFYPPLVGIGGDTLYCKGGSATLKGYGAYRYQWSDGSVGDSIKVSKDSEVWMIGYSSEGCYTDTIRQKVKQAPVVPASITGQPEYCFGDNSTLTASAGVSYLWSTGESTRSIIVKTPGIYSVRIKDNNGCENSDALNVTEQALPVAVFSTSRQTVDERNNSVVFKSADIPGIQYKWDMGDGSIQTGAEVTHMYQVDNGLPSYKVMLTATSHLGCTSSEVREIEIVPFIPNVFTPNDDGINDIFVPGLKVQILDRFGRKLYDGTTGWNGTFNGLKCGNDTYFYFIDYTDLRGVNHKLKGFVLLKR